VDAVSPSGAGPAITPLQLLRGLTIGSPDDILARLQEAGRRDLGDFLTFEVGPDEDHPEIQNDGMPYDGLRFRAECKLARKVYGQPFGVDVAFGDPILGEPAIVVAEDVLAFAGIAPPTLRLYPIETHLARAARRLDDALRSDGPRRPAGVAHSRRGDQGGPDLPRSRPRRRARCNVGARDVELATSLN